MEGHRTALQGALLEALTQAHQALQSEGGSFPDTGPSGDENGSSSSVAGLMRLVDAVAVTRGPGLVLCLRVGCKVAQVCFAALLLLALKHLLQKLSNAVDPHLEVGV